MAPGDPDIKTTVLRLSADANPIAARKGGMMLALVRYLEARGPAPTAFAYLSGDELWLIPTNRYNRARVQVAVVWRDYGPLRDGCPEMYYRLSIRRGGAGLSREERSSDPSEVERAICGAFGWMAREVGDPD
ncbi:hypothetical protein HK102_011267 [Quaeritorhiza haematococci]|nr:hypothetical protein HK102_011267 [Quaeritorhiza haematococci]